MNSGIPLGPERKILVFIWSLGPLRGDDMPKDALIQDLELL